MLRATISRWELTTGTLLDSVQSLVLSFMNSCMTSLSEDAPIKQTWLVTGNVRREFPCHQCMSVSNMYVKTSGRTWRIGGAQN
jgi:hypothetical protein